MNRTTTARNLLLAVYVAVSIATFQHTAWGFGTLAGAQPVGFAAAWWWLMGGLMAAAVDVGMGVIIWLKMQARRNPAHIWILAFLALFSAYAQLIFAAHHAAHFALGAVPVWLQWLQTVLEARTVVLPLALPGLALIAGFAAQGDGVQQPAQPVQSRVAQSVQPATLLQSDVVDDATPVQPQTAAERKAVAMQLHRKGKSNAEIAGALGVHTTTVSRYLAAQDGRGRG